LLQQTICRVPAPTQAVLGNTFWARGYFCASSGNVTDEMIKMIETYLEHHFSPQKKDTFQTES